MAWATRKAREEDDSSGRPGMAESRGAKPRDSWRVRRQWRMYPAAPWMGTWWLKLGDVIAVCGVRVDNEDGEMERERERGDIEEREKPYLF